MGIEKILVTVLQKLEAKILAIQESYGLKILFISELISKLKA